MPSEVPPKEVLQELKEWLGNHKYNYTTTEFGSGGCETCGYGAEEYEVVDGDKLLAEIDKFAESFKKS